MMRTVNRSNPHPWVEFLRSAFPVLEAVQRALVAQVVWEVLVAKILCWSMMPHLAVEPVPWLRSWLPHLAVKPV